jgi:hypothetical protein
MSNEHLRRALADIHEAAQEAKAAEEASEPAFTSMKLPELKAYAAEHGIDLGSARSKADVLAEIVAAEASAGDAQNVPAPGDEEADESAENTDPIASEE